MINSAFARDTGGEQNLISTLQQNFDITINHYVQVNFDSFRQVVDSIGGVPVWMPTAARDPASGFYNDQLGCVNMTASRGSPSCAAASSRSSTEDEDWVNDPLSDQNRVQRQQIFIQRAMTDALAEVKSNPLRLRELVDIGVSNIVARPQPGHRRHPRPRRPLQGLRRLQARGLPAARDRVPARPQPAAARRGRRRADAQRVPGPGRGRDPAGPRDGQGAQRHRRRRGAAARGPGHRRQRRPPAGGLPDGGPRRRRGRSTRRPRSSTRRGSRPTPSGSPATSPAPRPSRWSRTPTSPRGPCG